MFEEKEKVEVNDIAGLLNDSLKSFRQSLEVSSDSKEHQAFLEKQKEIAEQQRIEDYVQGKIEGVLHEQAFQRWQKNLFFNLVGAVGGALFALWIFRKRK